MRNKIYSFRVMAIVLVLIFFSTVRTNILYASALSETADLGKEEQGYVKWQENEKSYCFAGGTYNYSPYYERDPQKSLDHYIGVCPVNETEFISFLPDSFLSASHYGLNGHILYTESRFISEDGVAMVRFVRIADGEQQVIWQAERSDVPALNYIGGSFDGRYHYIQTRGEKNADGVRDFCYYRYDDLKEEYQKIDTLSGKPMHFAGAAVSPDGYYFVLGIQTEDNTAHIGVYSVDGKEDVIYDFENDIYDFGGLFYNMSCDNHGNILFQNKMPGEIGVIYHSTGRYKKLDLDAGNWNYIANIDCSRFILSDGQSIWFYSLEEDAPIYVCAGENVVLMAPDAMKFDRSRAFIYGLTGNMTYYTYDFNDMCICTSGSSIYRIDDFDKGNITLISSCTEMYDFIGFNYSMGLVRDFGYLSSYRVREDLSQIIYLDMEGLHLLDVKSGTQVTLYKYQDTAIMAVNQDFSKAVMMHGRGYVLIDLASQNVVEHIWDMDNYHYFEDICWTIYSVTTDDYEGLVFGESGHLGLLDFDGNIQSIDTSAVECEFLGINNFEEESYHYSVEINGSRLWCTQKDEKTASVYRLNNRLQLEEVPVRY